jgi:hypothetical protein
LLRASGAAAFSGGAGFLPGGSGKGKISEKVA